MVAQMGLRVAAPGTLDPDVARADRLYLELQGAEGAEAVLALLVPDDGVLAPPALPSWDELGALRSGTGAEALAAGIRGWKDEGHDPHHRFERRWRAARLALGLGIMAEEWEAQARWYGWGILWSLETMASEARLREQDGQRTGLDTGRDVDGMEGLFWLAALVGRYALDSPSDPERGRAGDAAFRLASYILERDPDHAGAHNVLGRSHLEVRRLSLPMRILARAFMGGDFVSRTSWEDARRHLTRAVELDPDLIYFRLDLALYHRARGDVERFRREVDTLLQHPRRHPIDGWIQEQVRGLPDRNRSVSGLSGAGTLVAVYAVYGSSPVGGSD